MHIKPDTKLYAESPFALLRRKSREWRGVTKWSFALATIDSCLWTSDGEGGGSFETKFFYYVEGVCYFGKFSKAGGTEQYPPFNYKDTIDIQYDPKHPSRCFYADAFTTWEKVWLWIIVIVTILIAHRLITGSFAWPSFFSGDSD
jgi:hypothetical protein